MPFINLVNSTTADATDVNANFYWIGQGTRLPLGGTNLEATDSVYDLGSSTTTWNNLFCQNIYINASITTADKSLWILEAETTLSATASSIEFTGLNGDDAEEYKIFWMHDAPTSGSGAIVINGISGTNYGYQLIKGEGAVVSAERNTSSAYIYSGPIQTKYNFSIINMNTKTGIQRMIQIFSMRQINSTTVNTIIESANVWNDTATTITSLKFYGVANPDTHIEIWKRG